MTPSDRFAFVLMCVPGVCVRVQRKSKPVTDLKQKVNRKCCNCYWQCNAIIYCCGMFELITFWIQSFCFAAFKFCFPFIFFISEAVKGV